MTPSSWLVDGPRRTAQITLTSFLQPGAPPEAAKAPVIILDYVRKRMATNSYGHPEWAWGPHGWAWKQTVSDTAAPSTPSATLQRCGSSSSENSVGMVLHNAVQVALIHVAAASGGHTHHVALIHVANTHGAAPSRQGRRCGMCVATGWQHPSNQTGSSQGSLAVDEKYRHGRGRGLLSI